MTIGTAPGDISAHITIDCTNDIAVPDSAHGCAITAVTTPNSVYQVTVDERFRGDRARVDVVAYIECGTGVNSRMVLQTGGGMNPTTGVIVLTVTDLAGAPATSLEFIHVTVWRAGRVT